MNWLPLNMKTSVWTAILFVSCGCGVKGDPLPPERPADLGRGRPTYKKATEKIKVNHSPGAENDEDEREDHDGDAD